MKTLRPGPFPGIILTSVVSLAISLPLQAQPSRYVDPFIGTDGMGHTFPGACIPFGGVQLSPDTDTIPHNVAGKYQAEVYSLCSGYRYSDPTIVGFSHTHLSGTGHSDLGDVLLMPTAGPLHLNPGTASDPTSGYRSRFSHSAEWASPGRYEVVLEDYGIKAELTATPRCGLHRYTFPPSADGNGSDRHLIMDLDHGIYNYDGKVLWSSVRVVNDTLVTGWRLTDGWARENFTFFAITFSRPISTYGYEPKGPSPYEGFWRKMDTRHGFPQMAGRGITCWFDFGWDGGGDDPDRLEVRVGLSATSASGALRNLLAETGGRSFDALRAQAAELWDKELSVFDIEAGEKDRRMFYTSLYHTLINPSLYCDVDGAYRGLDGEIHHSAGWDNYTVFSLWDTYRAEHPLLTLTSPGRARDMVLSMLEHYRQSPHHLLPIWSLQANEGWCMSGYHSVSVLSDAITKGLDLPGEDLLEAMVGTSTVPYLDGLDAYVRLGYVPFEVSSVAASNTLEYSYDDWAIYAAAKYLGREDVASRYRGRAGNWTNIYPVGSPFATPRYADGRFKAHFDPGQTWGEGFIEGNSRNFSFHVPHDVIALMDRMGGEKAFLSLLDTLFTRDLDPKYYELNEDITEDCLMGGYVHGNEPSHHIPYLYAWTGEPWKGQKLLRDIITRFYRPEVRGLGGNDDCGQMSAWYIFSVMGFYPVCPGSGEYVLGAPYLERVTLSLPEGKTFTVRAEGVSGRNCYVGRVLLNGKPYTKRYITHGDIMGGGELTFEMRSTHPRRSTPPREDLPYSMGRE